MTKIEWVRGSDGAQGKTWNPIAGCTVLTPGCTHCYAMKMAARLEAMGQELYAGLTKPSKGGAVWTGIVRQAPEHVLLAPLRRKKPTTYFVNSMSDLYHESVPDEWIDRVFAVMEDSEHHTYQVLTKRSDRMLAYWTDPETPVRIARWIKGNHRAYAKDSDVRARWPLPNVWAGISAERQPEWDERKHHLRNTPAAVRFASFEPLLGKIIEPRPISDFIQWAIVGGESGPKARPFHVEWLDSIIARCKAANVACFVKQMGTMPISDGYPLKLKSRKGGDASEWPARLRVRQFPLDHTVPAGLKWQPRPLLAFSPPTAEEES